MPSLTGHLNHCRQVAIRLRHPDSIEPNTRITKKYTVILVDSMIHVFECREPVDTKPGTTGTLWYNKYWQTDGSKEHVLRHEGKTRVYRTRYHYGGHKQKLIQSFGAAGYAIVRHGVLRMRFANTHCTGITVMFLILFEFLFLLYKSCKYGEKKIKRKTRVNRVALVPREIEEFQYVPERLLTEAPRN